MRHALLEEVEGDVSYEASTQGKTYACVELGCACDPEIDHGKTHCHRKRPYLILDNTHVFLAGGEPA